MLPPEQIVQKNLDYYNARDIDGFMSLMADDIKFYNFSDGKVTITGLDECRKFYSELFDLSPELHSNKVIDHECITGRNGSSMPVELVLIYEVKDNLIYKVTVMRK